MCREGRVRPGLKGSICITTLSLRLGDLCRKEVKRILEPEVMDDLKKQSFQIATG